MPRTEEQKAANREANRRYYARNREKMRARERTPERRAAAREWARNNPDKIRNSFLRRKFGITLDDYLEMAEAQRHRCSICGKTREEECRDLAVDHCHETGKVRALLCTNCNTDLHVLERDPERLRRMLEYLEKHKET